MEDPSGKSSFSRTSPVFPANRALSVARTRKRRRLLPHAPLRERCEVLRQRLRGDLPLPWCEAVSRTAYEGWPQAVRSCRRPRVILARPLPRHVTVSAVPLHRVPVSVGQPSSVRSPQSARTRQTRPTSTFPSGLRPRRADPNPRRGRRLFSLCLNSVCAGSSCSIPTVAHTQDGKDFIKPHGRLRASGFANRDTAGSRMSLDVHSQATLFLLAQHKGTAIWRRRRDEFALCRLLAAENAEGREIHACLASPPPYLLPVLRRAINAARS